MQQPNQEETYDNQAQDFAEHAPQLMTWKYVGMPALDKNIDYNPDLRIFDQGSASARLEQHFLTKGLEPRNMLGVEISNEQVKIAKRLIPHASFVHGDIRTYEPEAESFDYAVSHMVYEFLDNDGLLDTLKNAHKGLKKSGKLVYVVTHPEKMAHQGHKPGWFETYAPWGGTVGNYCRSVDEFINITLDAGFEGVGLDHLKIPLAARAESVERYKHYNNYPYIRLCITATKE